MNAAKKSTQTVRVVTDSVSQIPTQLADELGIPIIPFTVTIQGVSYLDGVDLDPQVLYQRMRVEKVIPKTSAPTPSAFIDAIERCIHEEARAILCVLLSSNLSGTYNACLTVVEILREKHPQVTIEVFDSKAAAIAEGYIALEAARAARAGENLEGVIRVARETQKQVGIVVSFDTLEYLALGGRIGKAAYLMGNLININPIISLDSEGRVEPIGKVRGNQHAIEAILDQVDKSTPKRGYLSLALMDADAPERVEMLRDLAIQRFKPDELLITSITPVMGAHTGPGLIGLGYFYRPK